MHRSGRPTAGSTSSTGELFVTAAWQTTIAARGAVPADALLYIVHTDERAGLVATSARPARHCFVIAAFAACWARRHCAPTRSGGLAGDAFDDSVVDLESAGGTSPRRLAGRVRGGAHAVRVLAMFSLAEIAPVDYREPWDLGFDDRLAALERRPRRIAYLYDLADNSTFRYPRLQPGAGPQRVERRSLGRLLLRSRPAALRPHRRQRRPAGDVPTKYSDVINSIATQFRNRGRPVVYDIDDLVFDPVHAHLIARTIGHPLRDDATWSEWFGYVARCGTAMRLCDGCIATNDRLAAHIEAFLGKPVKLLQNFINREQLEVSDRVWAAKAALGFRGDGRIGLGYFSGTPTHRHDFAIAWPAIAAVMRARPAVELTVVGHIDIDAIDTDLQGRVRKLPFVDYVNLQRAIGEIDLNLVPLQNNVFAHCKSELKYFEAAIVGTPTIASPAHTLAARIADGVNGYLARAHEWEPVLLRAIDDLGAPERMARAARADAEARYAWDRRPRRRARSARLALTDAVARRYLGRASGDRDPARTTRRSRRRHNAGPCTPASRRPRSLPWPRSTPRPSSPFTTGTNPCSPSRRRARRACASRAVTS
jgi:glycosyltransferase involved in cell wall biosynthesis